MRAEILAMNVFVLSFVSLLAITSGRAGASVSAADGRGEIAPMRSRHLRDRHQPQSRPARPLQCDLAQTWYKEDIAKAVKKGRLSWTFGDARCTAKFEFSRALFAAPFKEKTYTLKLPAHPVACEIDNSGSRHELRAKMAPVIEFENGKAKSVSLGVTDIDGTAVVRNVVWAAWKFENTFGYFQADFVKGVNEYITEHCPKQNARRLGGPSVRRRALETSPQAAWMRLERGQIRLRQTVDHAGRAQRAGQQAGDRHGPTPPGTGVIAPATCTASAKATSPTIFVLPSPFSGAGTRLTPTSITNAPGLIQSPLHHLSPADGGDKNIGAARYGGEFARPGMSHGDRRILARAAIAPAACRRYWNARSPPPRRRRGPASPSWRG